MYSVVIVLSSLVHIVVTLKHNRGSVDIILDSKVREGSYDKLPLGKSCSFCTETFTALFECAVHFV